MTIRKTDKSLHVLWRPKLGGVETLHKIASKDGDEILYIDKLGRGILNRIINIIFTAFRNNKFGNIVIWSQSPIMLLFCCILVINKKIFIHFGQPVARETRLKTIIALKIINYLSEGTTIFCISDYVFNSIQPHISRRGPKFKNIDILPVKNSLKIDRCGNLSDEKHLIYIGRIEPIKNIDKTLNAAKKMGFRGEFILIGPIEDHKYFKHIESSYRIKYLGASESPFNLIENYDVNIFMFLPSEKEGLGLTLLESLEYGFSVITWKAGEIAKVFPSDMPSRTICVLKSFDDSYGWRNIFLHHFEKMIYNQD